MKGGNGAGREPRNKTQDVLGPLVTKIVGSFNGHDIMVVKVQGEFVWHSHRNTDDFFLVLKGNLTIRLKDGDVHLGPGDL
jgi:mannose-6-phosphate isomerase-like protein (cupin superfamily)